MLYVMSSRSHRRLQSLLPKRNLQSPCRSTTRPGPLLRVGLLILLHSVGELDELFSFSGSLPYLYLNLQMYQVVVLANKIWLIDDWFYCCWDSISVVIELCHCSLDCTNFLSTAMLLPPSLMSNTWNWDVILDICLYLSPQILNFWVLFADVNTAV